VLSVAALTAGCVQPVRLLAWDSEDRLALAVAGGQVTRYGYDAEGQRIKKSAGTKTTRYFGNLVEIEREGDQETITKYYYAEGMLVAQRRDGAVQYVHQDHLDSLRVLSDASGAPVATREFAAFGEQVGSGGTATLTRGYGAHWQDGESGLIYMGARYYDPVITRFIQPDSVVPEPDDPQSWNRYSFVRNNPFNRVDPTGNWDLDPTLRDRFREVAGHIREKGNEVYRALPPETQAAVRAAIDAATKVGEIEDAVVDRVIDMAVGGGRVLHEDPDGFAEKMLDKAKDEETRKALEAALEQVPEDWTARESDSGGGVEFTDSENPHNKIRVMPGNPDSRWESQREPYVKDQRHGQPRNVHGDPVENKSRESHIPARDFRYRR